MKKVLFNFLDLKYSGKSIVMYSYSNDDASSQIYVVEDTNDTIMHISDFGGFTEFKVNNLLNKHILFDFYIVGFEVCRVNGNATSISQTVEGSQYTANFINGLTKQYLPANAQEKFTISQNSKLVDYKLNGFAYPWMRFGIGIGYRF